MIPAVLGSVFLFSRYITALAPTVYKHDPGELQLLSGVLGIPHATGYPLYIWTGKLFSFIPIGDLAYRINLMSAVFAAATVFLFSAISASVLKNTNPWISHLSGTFAGLCYGFSYAFWGEAILAEMYTLHVFLLLLTLLLLLKWSRKSSSLYLWVGLFVFGAMFGNHFSAVALMPGVVIFLLLHDSRQWLRWQKPASSMLAFISGFLVCNVFLFWLLWRREVPFDHWHSIIIPSLEFYPELQKSSHSFWHAWWFTVTGGQFKGSMMSVPISWQVTELHALLYRIAGQFFPLMTVLAGVGIVGLWHYHWRFGLMTILVFSTQVALNINYYVPNKVLIYYITPYAMVAVWISVGLVFLTAGILAGLKRIAARRFPTGLEIATLILVLVAVALINLKTRDLYSHWLKTENPKLRAEIMRRLGPNQNYSNHYVDRDLARDIVSVVDPNAIIFTDWYMKYPIEYVARIEFGVDSISVYEGEPGVGKYENKFPQQYKNIIIQNFGKRMIYFTYFPRRQSTYFGMERIKGHLWKVSSIIEN